MTGEHEISGRDSAGATARLRGQLLQDSSGGECLTLAHVDHVAGLIAADSLAARQKLLMGAIRSLIDDGQMVIGNIDGGSDERVEPWDLSLDDAMAQVYDEYVVNHDDRNWIWRTWFALTDSGERAAQALEAKKSEG